MVSQEILGVENYLCYLSRSVQGAELNYSLIQKALRRPNLFIVEATTLVFRPLPKFSRLSDLTKSWRIANS